jgi:transcriptional regulator with XRE-family HTH domain
VKNKADFQKQLTRIGEKLAELRRQKGYSIHETFAYDYEMSRVQYWRIEKGKTNLMLKSHMRLLEIHGISLKEFFNTLSK